MAKPNDLTAVKDAGIGLTTIHRRVSRRMALGSVAGMAATAPFEAGAYIGTHAARISSVSSLQELKGLAPAIGIAIWRGVPFVWETNRSPYASDEDGPAVTVVESNFYSARHGAWVRLNSCELTQGQGRSEEACQVQCRVSQWENVKDYGARGDGRADDTSSIQAAIDRTHSLGGGTVFIPRGNFRIRGTLYGRAGVSILGQGSLASRLLKVGAGHCIVFDADKTDADFERIALERFAIIGTKEGQHLFWGRKAATAFALRDLYFEGSNSPVVLDSCYSLVMENTQVRSAETGNNITINSVSHNVMLLQVTSQIAKNGAGIQISGSNSVVLLGGKLEFNGHDQLSIRGGCRGVFILGLYVEGIQPMCSGYAGIAVHEADTVSVVGGFFDATQGNSKSHPSGGPMGTNGTGVYLRVRGPSARVSFLDYGFASIAPTQVHVHIESAAHASDVKIPLGAFFINEAPDRNRIRFSSCEEKPLNVIRSDCLRVKHGQETLITFPEIIDDIQDEWQKEHTFSPKQTDYYTLSGAIQLSNVPPGSYAAVLLYSAKQERTLARLDRCLPPGSPNIDFLFRVRLVEYDEYQIRVLYHDSQQQHRATSACGEYNQMIIARLG